MAKGYGTGDDMQGNNTSGLKRQRVALACNPCRTRKSRCNGARPKCDLCERMAFDCTYDAPGSAANVIIPKDAFTDIESRLHMLEQVVKRHNEQLATRSISTASDKGISNASTDFDSPGHGLASLVHRAHEQDQEQEPDDHTDGMAISFVDEKDQGFFGPSANISFMRIILRSMLAASTGPGFGSGSGMINMKPLNSRTVSSQAATSTGLAGLPPEDITERLLIEYFSNTGILFPYIHEPTFMDTYRQARQSGFAGVRRTWLALLNIVLAMATRADATRPDTSFAAADAELFFKRARSLCGTHMLRGTTLETVQYLLLSTQYLQGTQHAVQTWTTHGLAVKTALSIGLHSQAASSGFAPVEREMRKRTWYGCIVLDRSLSMTFGRPSAIPEDYVRLDLPAPIEGDRENGLSALFFSATITLYRILWKIIASVYGHNIEHEELSNPDLMTRIIQLEQDLDQWRASLPAPLALRVSSPSIGGIDPAMGAGGGGDRPDMTSPATASPGTPGLFLQVDKFRNILTLRYLNTKLLLLRPILTNTLHAKYLVEDQQGQAQQGGAANPFAPSPGGGGVGSAHHRRRSLGYMQSNYFTAACFRGAVDTISIIHAAVTRPELGKHMLGAWWFTLCYAFNASLTIFGILLLIPDAEQDHGSSAAVSNGYNPREEEEGRDALTKAIEALGALASDNALVDRCVEHLRQLVHLIDSRRAANMMPSSSTSPPAIVVAAMNLNSSHNNTNNDASSFMAGGGQGMHGGVGTGVGVAEGDFLVDESSILGMSFPDYHSMMLEDEVGPGLFFRDDNSQPSWLDFGYQL
ncbi:fungal-specific transcription factor domain-domain-containing protein [Microdochium bolleyi]|uniref:Fungal-specific transcription factor domain-domain-containing protein n=1 Tax=Microdochium bolleyi TaxID=196109 RepID=A0A136IYK3_9PEZI|nr:fungal-specific transcription factor domain-domain-containing protein [Microdochium bolleyi]